MMNVVTTNHSFDRQNQRMFVCSLEKHKNYAERAWRNGKTISDYTGKAYNYLYGIETRHDNNSVVRVFAGYCFIYTKNGVLKTLFQVNPKKMGRNRLKSTHHRGEDTFFTSDCEVFLFLTRILKIGHLETS